MLLSIIADYADFCPVGMDRDGQSLTDLLEVTANALSSDVVALMFLAVQRDDLRLSIGHAVQR
jgi:hypothetical protein